MYHFEDLFVTAISVEYKALCFGVPRIIFYFI